MVKEINISENKIVIKDGVFSLKQIHKEIKELIEELGYGFVEKQQTNKPKKYGAERKIDFLAEKQIDDFAKFEITVNFFIEYLKILKKGDLILDNGEGIITVKSKLTLDFGNKWSKNEFSRFLFKLYIGFLKKSEIENKYVAPLSEDVKVIYSKIKELMQYY